jgi:uncharacterized phage protein (TIGR02220 family)
MFIVHETGIPFEVASKALRSLSEVGFCSYDPQMEYVWVHEMALYQIGKQLKRNDNRVRGINETVKNLPNLAFLPRFFEKYKDIFYLENLTQTPSPLEAPSEPLRSQEQEQEQEQDKKIFMSGKPDADPLCEKNSELKTQAHEVLNFLNAKTERAYRPVDTNLKLIIARLKSGATVMDCRQVIAKKTREWKSDAKMSEYLRPATLFNATKFEQYMGELVQLKEETQ